MGWYRPTHISYFAGIRKHPLLKLSAGFSPTRRGYLLSDPDGKNFRQRRYFSIGNQPPEITRATPDAITTLGKTPVIKTSERFLADRCMTFRARISGIGLPRTIRPGCGRFVTSRHTVLRDVALIRTDRANLKSMLKSLQKSFCFPKIRRFSSIELASFKKTCVCLKMRRCQLV